MTKVVLISGASGFTGKAVMREFSSNGWVVIPLVRKPLGLDNEYIVDNIWNGNMVMPRIGSEDNYCIDTIRLKFY